MKKLVVLMFVLAFCAQSFGADANDLKVLVYKVSLSGKNVIVDGNFNAVDNNDTAANIKSSVSFKGFLVFEVNDVNLVVVTDTNNNGTGDPCAAKIPKLILVGKDPKTGVKTVTVLDTNGGNFVLRKLITTETKAKKFGAVTWTAAGSSDANYSSAGSSFGALKATALTKGSKVKTEVPTSLKGSAIFDKDTSVHGRSIFNIPFGGSAALILDTGKTGTANANHTTVAAEAAALAASLE